MVVVKQNKYKRLKIYYSTKTDYNKNIYFVYIKRYNNTLFNCIHTYQNNKYVFIIMSILIKHYERVH